MESFGIAVFNQNNELLMIKKRCSYAFYMIAKGNYSKKKASLAALLSKTTFLEKSIILQRNFDFIYFHAFASDPYTLSFQDYKRYDRARFLFHRTFTFKLLEELVYGAKSEDLIWEFPKGRIGRESALDCAKREFFEETGISEYELLACDPIVFDFSDANEKFRYTLYLARAKEKDLNCFRPHHFSEVSEIKWINPKTAKILLDKTSLKLFNIIRQKVKKLQKKNLATGF